MPKQVAPLLDVLSERLASRPEEAAGLRHRREEWEAITWRQLDRDLQRVVGALEAQGLRAGDDLLLVVSPRYEWLLVDLAVMWIGARLLPIAAQDHNLDLMQILPNSKAKIAVVEGPLELGALLRDGHTQAPFEAIFYLEARHQPNEGPPLMLDDVSAWPPDDRLIALDEVFDESHPVAAPKPPHQYTIGDEGADESVAFTAGTTGPLKAVRLNHQKLFLSARALAESLELRASDTVLINLPLAHSFGRTFLYAALISRSAFAFAHGLGHVLQAMIEVNPSVVVSVPRMFERIHSGVLADLQRAHPLQRAVFSWALETGKEVSKLRQSCDRPKGLLAIKSLFANKFVFKRSREFFGEKLRYFVSAGGALSSMAAEFFHACDVLVLEGYGLTEAGGLAFLNRPEHFCLGSVGRSLPHLRPNLLDSGELELRGDSLMLGYDLELTPHAGKDQIEGLVKEGAETTLKTGDFATRSEQGWLTILGRREEKMTTLEGAKLFPRTMEQEIERNPLISHVLLVGDQQPFVAALIALDRDLSKRWLQEHGDKSSKDPRQLFYDQIKAWMDEYSATLAPTQKVQKFAILEEELAAAVMTPMLEIKRALVKQEQAHLIASFYEEPF